MNSMSEYFDSDDLARFGSFRFTGGIALSPCPDTLTNGLYSKGIIANGIIVPVNWCGLVSLSIKAQRALSLATVEKIRDKPDAMKNAPNESPLRHHPPLLSIAGPFSQDPPSPLPFS